jgi:hypothetical protein
MVETKGTIGDFRARRAGITTAPRSVAWRAPRAAGTAKDLNVGGGR